MPEPTDRITFRADRCGGPKVYSRDANSGHGRSGAARTDDVLLHRTDYLLLTREAGRS